MNPSSRDSRVLPAFEATCSEFRTDGRKETMSSSMKKASMLDAGVASLEGGDAGATRRLGSVHASNTQPQQHPATTRAADPFSRKNQGGTASRPRGVMDGMRSDAEGAPEAPKDLNVLRTNLKNLRNIMKTEKHIVRRENLKTQVSELEAQIQIEQDRSGDTNKAEQIAKRDWGRDFGNALEKKEEEDDADEVEEVLEPPSNSDFQPTTTYLMKGSKRSKNMVETAQGRFKNARLGNRVNLNTRMRVPALKGASNTKKDAFPFKPPPLSDEQFFGASTSATAFVLGKDSERSRTRSRPIQQGSATANRLGRKPPPPKAPDSPVEILDDTTDEDEADKTLPLQEDPITLSSGHRRSARLASTFGSGETAVWRQLKGLNALYPAGNPADCLPISSEDLSRLAPEEFLNDSVIDFYMRFLRHEELKDQQELKDRCHFFNSYFYKKLTERPKDGSGYGMDERHARVKRWTKGVDIFEKDYLFVPIHDALHWSLAIVCYPGGCEGGRTQPTQILHLDSLSGCHNTATITFILRTYLQVEWSEKQDVADSIPGCYASSVEPKQRDFGPKSIRQSKLSLPQQGNHTDCGLFLLTFLQYFLFSAPHLTNQEYDFCSPEGLKEIRATSFPGAEDFLSKSWFRPSNASQLRCFLQYQILKVLQQQSKCEETDRRVGVLERQIKEYEARAPESKFKSPVEDIPFRRQKRKSSQGDVINLNDCQEEGSPSKRPSTRRKNSRHLIFDDSDDDDGDDVSQGSGDGILVPQSVRENARSSAGAAADAPCAPAAAPEAEAEAAEPDDEHMGVNLSEGLDNVHLGSGSRPRGGGGPRRNDPEVEALEGEEGGAWEDEDPAGQGQEAQEPEDDEEWSEEEDEELREDEEQGEVEQQQPLWKNASANLSKASGVQIARSTPALEDEDEEEGSAEVPQGSCAALKALRGYGDRSGEGEPEAGADCSGDEDDELEGGGRRPRDTTPVCPNGPYGPPDQVNRSRPASPDVLAAEPSPAGKEAEHGSTADEELPSSEDPRQEGFRWIPGVPEHDLKDHGGPGGEVLCGAKVSASISGSEEVPPTQVVSGEEEEVDAPCERRGGAGGGAGPSTQASVAGRGASQAGLGLTSREEAAQGAGDAASAQAGSSCFPPQPQQHQDASSSPPGGAGFAVHRRRLSGESRQQYRKPAGARRADNSSGAPPVDDCVISSSSPSATSSGNLQASEEVEVEAEEPPNRRRLTAGQRGKAAAAPAPDKARHEVIEIS